MSEPGSTPTGDVAVPEGARDRPNRRWDDRPGALPALTFARYLTGTPTVPEAMRFLVGLLSWPISAKGALLLCPHDQGITVCSRFEESIDDTALAPATVDVDGEVADIVRATEGAHAVLWTAPEDATRTPMAAWPLGMDGNHWRVLLVTLAAPCDPDRVAERTVGVSEALAVYLAGARAELAVPRTVGVPTPARMGISPRQTRVLELMAEDLTMRQIATHIGFSESTVRTESMAIYRTLGVHDRASAVGSARRLGIIPAPAEPVGAPGTT